MGQTAQQSLRDTPHVPGFGEVPTGRASAVIGLQWGDEGKGKLIDIVAGSFDAVVRFNGGANAGHTVVIGGEKHALHLVPSGIFHEGTLAVIGNGLVVDPDVLIRELDTLESRGIDTSGLRLSDRAHVVMPYHKQEDEALEKLLSGQATGSIGTTKRGIGPAYADKAHRSTAIRVRDLLDGDFLGAKLARICALKDGALRSLDTSHEPTDAEALTARAREWADRLSPSVTDTVYLLNEMLAGGKRVLFEGANATLLDVDHGTFPFVTSSSSSGLGVHAGSGVPGRFMGDCLGVMKAYSTRVGGGPFPTELDDETGNQIRDRGNEYGTTTGRPRRCGWLDLVAVKYAAMVSGATCLGLMLLDVLSGFDELRVCTRYEVDGQETDRFLPDASDLARAVPVYESVPGWKEEITGARTLDDLPEAAKSYIGLIENRVGLPVHIVSIGPDRSQTIVRV